MGDIYRMTFTMVVQFMMIYTKTVKGDWRDDDSATG